MPQPIQNTPLRDVGIPCEGVLLQGHLAWPAGARALVLFAHGSGSSRHSPRNVFVAQALQQAGLGTLLFDLLTPQEEQVDLRTREHRFDIGLLTQRMRHATDWVDAQDGLRGLPLGYFGASTGSAAALAAAADLGKRIGAVVSRGGRPDMVPPADLARVEAATLLIVGGNDEGVIELNEQAWRHLRCEKDFAIVPGATHLFEESGALQAVARLACGWFGRYLAEHE
ncbi:MAG: dienelactone hydrolase family protein [Burkholderiaceae bacterium]